MVQFRIRELAAEQGIGLKKLSRLADVSEITIRKIWRPEDYPNYVPTIPILERIALALHVELTDLFVPSGHSPSDDSPSARSL